MRFVTHVAFASALIWSPGSAQTCNTPHPPPDLALGIASCGSTWILVSIITVGNAFLETRRTADFCLRKPRAAGDRATRNAQ